MDVNLPQPGQLDCSKHLPLAVVLNLVFPRDVNSSVVAIIFETPIVMKGIGLAPAVLGPNNVLFAAEGCFVEHLVVAPQPRHLVRAASTKRYEVCRVAGVALGLVTVRQEGSDRGGVRCDDADNLYTGLGWLVN